MQGLTIQDLQRYDDNIRKHLAAINDGRPEPITLRYFQYLAALYSEIYLDWYFNRPGGLLPSLNASVSRHNSNCAPDQRWDQFTAEDLSKLAFWMATGGGKTLLLHLHYRQFMHYNRKPLDNILLITPNEGLSQQHLEELRASNIPAARFDTDEAGSLLSQLGTVRVTEITKLVEEKRGGGVRVPVETFEGNNLIFVDEGHKGAGGEAWRRNAGRPGRDRVHLRVQRHLRPGPGSGQQRRPADGVRQGHRLRLLLPLLLPRRLRQGLSQFSTCSRITRREQTDILAAWPTCSLSTNSSLYSPNRRGTCAPTTCLRPLWTFVGGSVNAVYQESGKPRSDILTVVRFLHRVVERPRLGGQLPSSELLGRDNPDLVSSHRTDGTYSPTGSSTCAAELSRCLRYL